MNFLSLEDKKNVPSVGDRIGSQQKSIHCLGGLRKRGRREKGGRVMGRGLGRKKERGRRVEWNDINFFIPWKEGRG